MVDVVIRLGGLIEVEKLMVVELVMMVMEELVCMV